MIAAAIATRPASAPFRIRRAGRFVDLVPIDEIARAEVDARWLAASRLPAMATPASADIANAAAACAMVSKRSRACVGVVLAWRVPGDALVLEVDAYREPSDATAGAGVEAVYLFCDALFAAGVGAVRMQVLAFNEPVRAMLTKIGKPPDARLRDHQFVAGRFVDAFVYVFTARQWRASLDGRASRLYRRDRRASG